MLLTQLFHIGSNILPTYTHSPPASAAQSSGYSGNICLFLGFSHVQMALPAPAPPSFTSEAQEELNFPSVLQCPCLGVILW